MSVRGRGGRRDALPGRSPCHHAAGFCTRFGLPHPVLTFLGLDHQHLSQSRFFFFLAVLSVFSLPRLWPPVTCSLISSITHLCSTRPPSPPPFFSHGNSKFEGRGVDLSQSSSLSPTSHLCAATGQYMRPPLLLLTTFSGALSPFLPISYPSLHDPDC